MKLEVLLSVMNLDKKDLDKQNITSKCTVINQCDTESFEKYKNFNIYSLKELGTSNSRNKGLDYITEDIIIFCDNDIVYNKDYEKLIIYEFEKNKDVDVVFFNFDVKRRNKRIIKRRKRLHIYNSLNYATYNIAIKKSSLGNIRFNTTFGPGARYSNGSDTVFIVDLFKNKLKVYSSPSYLGVVYNDNSTWFKGYNEKYFFNKGALFTRVNPKLRHILCLQYLIRHKDVLTNYKLFEAYKIMMKGSKDYLNFIKVD